MIELEDGFEDVLGKAIRGTGLAVEMLASLANVKLSQIEALLAGKLDEEALRAVAGPLGLDEASLAELAGSPRPKEIALTGLFQSNTLHQGRMRVNSYLIWDTVTREAALFDTGADATEILEKIEELGLIAKTLFVTHSHFDHIAAREQIEAVFPEIRTLVNGREPIAHAERFLAGDCFSIGTLRVTTRLTWGHSPAGTTFVIHGLDRPVAVVGDALFARSMGGAMISYQDALATNREQIFTLEDQTVICPGHGPVTSVREEKRHNPFFPEFRA